MSLEVESQNPSEQPVAGGDQPSNLPLLTRAFGSGLFSGYSPVASGTVGAAVGLAFYWIPGFEQAYVILPLSLLVFLLGMRAAGAMERVYGHDPAEVTVDEIVGMWVSLLFLPKSWVISVLAFFVFRILDIVKPYPARRFDDRKGGLGIMADDVISGVYTNIILQLLVAFHILP
jgi:phosphatidylglycerophosphatase A